MITAAHATSGSHKVNTMEMVHTKLSNGFKCTEHCEHWTHNHSIYSPFAIIVFIFCLLTRIMEKYPLNR